MFGKKDTVLNELNNVLFLPYYSSHLLFTTLNQPYLSYL